MPLKSSEERFYIQMSGGLVPVMPPTLSQEIVLDEQDARTSKVQHGEFVCEFDTNINMSADELWLILSGVVKEYQIQMNNWRRLHGLPMKRRKR